MVIEAKTPIRILIVDDSRVIRLLLQAIFDAELDLEVVGSAKNGKEAIELAKKLKPNLITMDIRMPVMNGFEAIKVIMREQPVPIVVISASVSNADLKIAFKAIEAGALTVLEKPGGKDSHDFASVRQALLDTVRAMAEIKVIRRRRIPVQKPELVQYIPSAHTKEQLDFEVVGLGASTGGPVALQTILSRLPENIPVPIVVVQHIAEGFNQGLVHWLSQSTPLAVRVAEDGEVLMPATVYFAPDAHHLLVQHNYVGEIIAELSDAPSVGEFRPSVTTLFQSLADNFPACSVGGILTGMGKDGVCGLLAMREKNCYTFAQDEASSVVFGMPGVALRAGAAEKAIPLEDIALHLINLMKGVRNN